MNIQKIQSNTSFKSWQREVYKKVAPTDLIRELKHRNDTWFFRGSLDWDILPKFLEEHFNDTGKVNTYFYGCSDGTDAYSYMMTMLTQLKGNAMKFLPVKAFDYDSYAIERARTGYVHVSEDEKRKIQYYTNNSMSEFLENKNDGVYKPKNMLSENIIFKYGDITKDYRRINPNDTIIAARNFWPYMEIEDRYKLAQNLYNHMGENSILFVGEYDMKEWDANLKDIFFKIGWEPTRLDCVFKKGIPHPYHKVY